MSDRTARLATEKQATNASLPAVRSVNGVSTLETEMTDIKPIETIYNGYRFRSRLEARWAVFFEMTVTAYEYEQEGFELGEGLRYLPDFWLPELRCHVEIKPNEDLSASELEKLVKFCGDQNQTVLLIVGSPTNEAMYLLDRRCLEDWKSTLDGASEAGLELSAYFWNAVHTLARAKFDLTHFVEASLSVVYCDTHPAARAIVASALLKAKQARFEHGENGR